MSRNAGFHSYSFQQLLETHLAIINLQDFQFGISAILKSMYTVFIQSLILYQCFNTEDRDRESEAADDDLELLSLRRPIDRRYGPGEKNDSRFYILTAAKKCDSITFCCVTMNVSKS